MTRNCKAVKVASSCTGKCNLSVKQERSGNNFTGFFYQIKFQSYWILTQYRNTLRNWWLHKFFSVRQHDSHLKLRFLVLFCFGKIQSMTVYYYYVQSKPMLLVFLGVPVPSKVSNLYVLNRYEALSPYTPIPISPYLYTW